MCRNANQHRGAPLFRKLQLVKRTLALLSDLQIPQIVTDLHGILQVNSGKAAPRDDPAGSKRAKKQDGGAAAASWTGSRQSFKLPSRQALALLLHRLMAGR